MMMTALPYILSCVLGFVFSPTRLPAMFDPHDVMVSLDQIEQAKLLASSTVTPNESHTWVFTLRGGYPKIQTQAE